VSPESPALTAEVRAEVLRLTSTDLRKASYPVTPGRRDKGSVALAARRVGQYLELAADGPTRTYSSNGTTVTEYDATEDTDGYITDLGELQAEITRYLNMRADLMRQSPLVGDAGNRSYSPPTGPPSASAPGLVPIGGAESAPDGTTSDPR
jgi:hypothetical protein